MKRIALITLGWSLAKPSKELEQDKARVVEILRRIGMGGRFNPDKHYYDFKFQVGSEA